MTNATPSTALCTSTRLARARCALRQLALAGLGMVASVQAQAQAQAQDPGAVRGTTWSSSTSRASCTTPPSRWTSAITASPSARCPRVTARCLWTCARPPVPWPRRRTPTPKPPRATFAESSGYQRHAGQLRAAADQHGVDEQLLKAIATAELGFNAQAVSPKGAIGLMQVIPDTALRFGVQGNREALAGAKASRIPPSTCRWARAPAPPADPSRAAPTWWWPPTTPGRGPCSATATGFRLTKNRQNYVKTVMTLYQSLQPAGRRQRLHPVQHACPAGAAWPAARACARACRPAEGAHRPGDAAPRCAPPAPTSLIHMQGPASEETAECPQPQRRKTMSEHTPLLDLSTQASGDAGSWPIRRASYLEYALSVVKGRALPDVCDGQKPVQRRILYAMERMGLGFSRGRRAKPVKAPAWWAMCWAASTRTATSRRLRRHGAHGARLHAALPAGRWPGQLRLSRDGDGAAAMRYTEARLTPISTPAARRDRHGHGGLRAQLRRLHRRSPANCRRVCPLCCSTAPAALPWAWPPKSPATTCARVAIRRVALIKQPA